MWNTKGIMVVFTICIISTARRRIYFTMKYIAQGFEWRFIIPDIQHILKEVIEKEKSKKENLE